MTDRDLFIAALEYADPAERDAWLAEACAGDLGRRRRVDLLLRAHDQASKFLVAPAVQQLARSPEDPTGSAFSADETLPPTGVDVVALLKPAGKAGLLGTLDHFEILEVVGSGGMGIVLKAFDPTLHRLVAIKLLAPHLAANAAARQRFGREAKANAAVRNEHVVAIHSVRAEGASPYLVMEFVGGVSLQDRLEQSGALGVKEILRIGAQAASGLAAAHGHGLVHRDVKPANILLENGVERVKLTDFGLARTADDASLTRSGVIIGTPNYMSPEQAAGEPTDARSDLFSLGSVLYAMCTGHPPFRAETPLAVLRRVADEPPRPIREINPDVPDWLAAIVHKLLAKDPADRFQTATAVADLFGRHLAHLQQPDAVPMPAPVGRAVRARTPTIVRVQATERGRIVSWSEFKRGRLVPPSRLARLLSWTTMLTDVVTDLIALGKSIDKETRLVLVTPNGPTTASFDLMLAGSDFEIICSRRLMRGGFPLNPLAAEFGSNYDVIISMNKASEEMRSKVMTLLRSKYQCTALDGTVEEEAAPTAAPAGTMPAPVRALGSESGLPAERVWTQIFEATDRRKWWAQRILVVLGFLLIIWDSYAMIQARVADQLGPELAGQLSFHFLPPATGPLRNAIFAVAGLLGVSLVVVGGFIAKVRWKIPYRGRMIRFEHSLFANESLFVDGVRIARGLFVLGNPREIRGVLPTGPGAGDEIRALARRGIGHYRVELFAGPGAGKSPYLAEPPPASLASPPVPGRWHPGVDGRTAFAIGFGCFVLVAGFFAAAYVSAFATSDGQKVDALIGILGGSGLLALLSFGPGVFVARRWWRKRQPSDRRADGRAAVFAGLGTGLTIAMLALVVGRTPALRAYVFGTSEPILDCRLAATWNTNLVNEVFVERNGSPFARYDQPQMSGFDSRYPSGAYTIRGFMSGREVYREELTLGTGQQHRAVMFYASPRPANATLNIHCSAAPLRVNVTGENHRFSVRWPGAPTIVEQGVKVGIPYELEVFQDDRVLHAEIIRLKRGEVRDFRIPAIISAERTIELKPKAGKFPTDVERMQFSANRSLVAVERASGPVTLFDSVTGRERFTIERPKADSSAFAFSPDGEWLAAVVPAKRNPAARVIRFYSTADGSGDAELEPGRGQLLANAHAVAISPDGKRVAVSAAHNFAPDDRFKSRIHRWVRNAVGAAWEELPPFEWQEGTVEGLRFTADGGELLAVSGAQSGAAVAWKWDTGDQWRKAETMFVPLDLLAVSDGLDFISGWDNKLNRPSLWSWPRRPDGAKETRPAEPLRVRPGPIRLASLAASRDGRNLAVATRGGKRVPWEQRAVIRLIDAKAEDDRAILLGHTDWALDLAFDATGKELMSASKDGTVRSWKLP